MANILLTEKCVRECPYCFAQKYMEGDSDKFLSWKNLVYLADFLKRTNEQHISLLGGEPTLHPNYSNIVLYLLNRGFHVTTFTSGVMSSRTLNKVVKDLAGIDPNRINIVCNVNHPEITPQKELDSQLRFLEKMGHLVSPGFNIYQDEFDMSFIFDYIEKYKLRRHVRLGLAHPIYGQDNSYIRPRNLRKMAEKLVATFPLFEKHDTSPGFDCGMPLCIYDNAELGMLMKVTKNSGTGRFSCGPAIDIGPNMDVWSCFPLSEYDRKSIFDFDDMSQVAEYYAKMLHTARESDGGVFDECAECQYRKNGACAGGCVVHGLNAAQKLRVVSA